MKALAKSIQIQYDKGCTDIEELAKINNVSINDVKKFLGKEEDIDRVAYFKKLALDEAIRFMEEDAPNATTKEIKDVVTIVDIITKKEDAQGPTINIAIQNLVERFKDDI